jgi:GDP-L-fucose synthase
MPDGTFRKLTDTSKLDSLGWKNELKLSSGIKKISDWYINNLNN